MTAFVPFLLFAALSAIGLLHANWARGSVWPAQNELQLAAIVVGDPRHPRMPPARLTWLVAGALAFAALDGLLLGFQFDGIVDKPVAWIGAGLVAVFACRGIAGYTPMWRKGHADPAFELLDQRFYSPFCILLAEGFFVLVSERL